jgi:hypothetical protein
MTLLLSSTGDWPARVLLSLVVVVAIVGCLALMRRGWTRRGRRQGDVGALPTVPLFPDSTDPHDVTSVPARYLGASRGGDWLDRVVVHGLGVPSHAEVTVRTSPATEAGVWVLRTGAPDLYVAAADVHGVRHDRAVAGRAFEQDGVLVLTWLHGGVLLDVGLRVRDGDVAEQLRQAIASFSPVTDAPSTIGGIA